MAELCLVGYTYRGYPMDYALAKARAFGYHGVELRDFADIDLATLSGVAEALPRAVALAQGQGLAICSVFYSPLPISRQGERAAEEWAFAEVIALVAAHRVPVLHTRLSLLREDGRGEVVAAGAREADYAAVRETLARVVPLAEKQGVCIAIETHMGTIHDTAASQLRIVAECGSSAFTASLDPANMLIAHRDEPLVETIAAFGLRIGYVHLKNLKLYPWGYDWNLPLRWGDINYARVLQALQEAGYRGPLAVEYCGTGDPDVFAADDARYLRELVARVGGKEDRSEDHEG